MMKEPSGAQSEGGFSARKTAPVCAPDFRRNYTGKGVKGLAGAARGDKRVVVSAWPIAGVGDGKSKK